MGYQPALLAVSNSRRLLRFQHNVASTTDSVPAENQGKVSTFDVTYMLFSHDEICDATERTGPTKTRFKLLLYSLLALLMKF